MKETDLAWAAGFIDGEGCIYINKSMSKEIPNRRKTTQRYQLALTAVQSDIRPINKLKDLFKAGSITEYDKGAYKTQWVWKVSGLNAERVLRSIFPYLVVKKDQARVGLQHQELINSNISRKPRSIETISLFESFYIKLREMKK